MPGTAINAINYDQNDELAASIEEVLQESSPKQAPPQQAPPQQQAPQYNPQPPAQYQPPPQQYQMPQQQYQQGPPQMPQMPPQGGYFNGGMENFQQPSSGFSFTLPDALKKSLMLLVILFVINNASFKNVLTKIPMTVNSEGQHTFLMTAIVCVLIAFVFFITSSVF